MHANEAEFCQWQRPFLKVVNKHLFPSAHEKLFTLHLPKFRCRCLYFPFTSIWAVKQSTPSLLIQSNNYFVCYRTWRRFSWSWRASVLSRNSSLLVQSSLRNNSKVDTVACSFACMWKNWVLLLLVALLLSIPSFWSEACYSDGYFHLKCIFSSQWQGFWNKHVTHLWKKSP